MKIQYYSRAADFLTHAGEFLTRDEARYALILGIARILLTEPHRYGKSDPWFCTLEDEDNIYAVAIRTPPFKILLSYFSGDVRTNAKNLVKSISNREKVIPGVAGEKELADCFTELWCQQHNVTVHHKIAQRIYRLTQVNDVPAAPGHLRLATETDKELMIKWAHAFHLDTFGESSVVPEEDFIPRAARREVFIWEEGKPVSIAFKTRPTEKGITVAGVYTPPEFRRQGYATSCVAEVCRHILQSGYEFCTLYTDLANPTSNSIYKKIGFREVCDSVDYTFSVL
jgi:uncharacterized protein